MSLERYFRKLGVELQRYLDDEISIDELADGMYEESVPKSIRNDPVYGTVWHAIFQYETDVMSDDPVYTLGIEYSMNRIVLCLRDHQDQLENALDRYFNHPCSD